MVEMLHIDNMEYMATCKNKQFGLAIVDPPYGIKESADRNLSRSKLARTKMYRKEFWDDDIPTQEYFDELFRISEHQIIFGINYFLGKRDIPFSAGRIIWDKVNGDSSFSDCEMAYCSFHHSTRLFRFMWNGMQQGVPGNGSVMQGNKKLNQKRIHPTEKPIPLYQWILRNYADPDMKIIDTHMGSGSLAIAAHDFGCDLVAMDNDKVFYDDAKQRFDMHKLQLKLL